MWLAAQFAHCWHFGHPAFGCPKAYPQCCRICGDPSHTAHSCHQAMWSRLCRGRPTASAHMPSSNASTVVPTTQPIPPLVRSLWKRSWNSAPEQVNCNWSEALLPVKLLCRPTTHHTRGPFPRPLISSLPGVLPFILYLATCSPKGHGSDDGLSIYTLLLPQIVASDPSRAPR